MPSCLIFMPNICSTVPSAIAFSQIRADCHLTPLLLISSSHNHANRILIPIALIRRHRRFLEELLPLLRQRRKREQRLRRLAGAYLGITIGHSDKDRTITTSSFDTERGRFHNGIAGRESCELTIVLCGFVGLVERSGKLRGQVCPCVGAGFG